MARQGEAWQTHNPFLWRFLLRNLTTVLFLAVALAGMVTTYWYFTPPAGGNAESFAVAGQNETLSAPIFKPVPARPVTQRYQQSQPPITIGLIAGHKDSDSGAVCQDGLTEAEINLAIVQRVAQQLTTRGLSVEILGEFDPRLIGYSATAVISIHADSCEFINDLLTGYKISGSNVTDSTQLYDCVNNAYADSTQLTFNANTITHDMTNYHAFREIAPGTPALIVETGFMALDRELLTNTTLPAEGIINGILCYIGDTP